MFNVTPPSSVWSTWPFLSISEKLLVGALIALSVYVLFAAVTTAICVRKTRASIREGKTVDFEGGFLELRKRSARLQKLSGTGFYLFGMVLFFGLQWAYFADDMSKGSGERTILIGFYPHFVFAFYVFLDLLILHLLGWFVSVSADAFGLFKAATTDVISPLHSKPKKGRRHGRIQGRLGKLRLTRCLCRHSL